MPGMSGSAPVAPKGTGLVEYWCSSAPESEPGDPRSTRVRSSVKQRRQQYRGSNLSQRRTKGFGVGTLETNEENNNLKQSYFQKDNITFTKTNCPKGQSSI